MATAGRSSMLSFLAQQRLASGTLGERADWITLDGGALLLILVAWVLGAGFAFSGILLGLSGLAEPPSRGTKRGQQALVCFALAAFLGLGLPRIFETMTRETRDALANAALLWAPALAVVCGLLVRRIGRPK